MTPLVVTPKLGRLHTSLPAFSVFSLMPASQLGRVRMLWALD